MNMAAFTYHIPSKTISCICEKVISGEHTCHNIRVKECNGENCIICKNQKDLQLFIDQWYQDRDGYTRCSTCEDKCYGDLPKECSCNAYVAEDGVEKCKSCKHPWNEKHVVFHECENCGFDGE